jgi:hypothetical protein
MFQRIGHQNERGVRILTLIDRHSRSFPQSFYLSFREYTILRKDVCMHLTISDISYSSGYHDQSRATERITEVQHPLPIVLQGSNTMMEIMMTT